MRTEKEVFPMGSPTAIAQAIHTTEGNSAYDAACKKILSNKIILAWIMKSCLEEYRDLDVTEIAEIGRAHV